MLEIKQQCFSLKMMHFIRFSHFAKWQKQSVLSKSEAFISAHIRSCCSIEEWREVSGYPDYHCSSLGRIKNIRRNKCLSINADRKRPQVWVSSNGVRRAFTLSRVILSTFQSVEKSDELQVNHKDGNPRNNAVSNLEWVTPSQNMQHSYSNGFGRGAMTPVCVTEIHSNRNYKFESLQSCRRFLEARCVWEYSARALTYFCQYKKERNGYRFMYADDAKYDWQVNDLPAEEWRLFFAADRGWDYFVSNFGRVKIRYGSGKELLKSPTLTDSGYFRVTVRGKFTAVHRIVAKTFVPNPHNHDCVDHIDTNPLNNKADNLRWVSHKQNMNNPLTLAKFKRTSTRR